MNRVRYMELHKKAWLLDRDTNNAELKDYLTFISYLYESGIEINDACLGIDLYHGEYTILDKAMGN